MANKPTYKELETLLHQLEIQYNQTRQSFAGFGHDFNNLITNLLGYTDLLLDETKDQPGNIGEYSKHIHDSSKLLVELVKQMSDFSKYKTFYKDVPNSEHSNIPHFGSDIQIYFVKDLLDGLATRIKSAINLRTAKQIKNPKISYRCYSDNLSLNVVKRELDEALFSLCVYSIDSLPSDAEIKLRSQLVDGSTIHFYDFKKIPYALIELEDNGPNIPEYIIPRIFEPFAKIDRIPSQDSGGSRLALSTCKAIIEKYMGHIFVESEKDKNTKFIIYLPAHNLK